VCCSDGVVPAQVTASPNCKVSITVLRETSSGGHKVKVSAAMVSDVFGPQGFDNTAHLNDLYGHVMALAAS
jgi:hypothetical protein